MSEGVKRTWAIDVCRTCGRLANWPFCEHRNAEGYAGGLAWYETITVTGKWHPLSETDEDRPQP